MIEASGGDSEKTLFCSFCGRSQHEVRALIAGPQIKLAEILKEDGKTQPEIGVALGVDQATVTRWLESNMQAQKAFKKDRRLKLGPDDTVVSRCDPRRAGARPTVFICDECVDLCMDIVREHKAHKIPK